MNRNDMRSVVYLIISLIALYYLLDEFYGKKKISILTDNFIGDFGGLPAKVSDSGTTGGGAAATEPVTVPAAAPAKDPGKVKIPAPQQDPGKVKIPQPQGAPKTKSGSAGGFSLNDIFGHFNPFPLGIPAAVAGGAAAVEGVLPEIGAAALLAL
jgi:hypothetical protein